MRILILLFLFMKTRSYFYAVLILFMACGFVNGQTGLDVTPPRSYFVSAPSSSSSNKIKVTNSSKTNSLTLTVSTHDWEYDTEGNNVIADAGTLKNSAANWVTISPQSYFSLAPGESQDIIVTVKAPALKADTLNVHTALLFITQTNPVDSYNQEGAMVKVTLRSGIKLYHRYNSPEDPNVEFQDYRYNKKAKMLELDLENTGNMWTDGTVFTELVNLSNGRKQTLEDQILYTLPGDRRSVKITLPKDLQPGKYTASSTFSYGNDDTIKMAELAFVHE